MDAAGRMSRASRLLGCLSHRLPAKGTAAQFRIEVIGLNLSLELAAPAGLQACSMYQGTDAKLGPHDCQMIQSHANPPLRLWSPV